MEKGSVSDESNSPSKPKIGRMGSQRSKGSLLGEQVRPLEGSGEITPGVRNIGNKVDGSGK
jgi:hypothetical protein